MNIKKNIKVIGAVVLSMFVFVGVLAVNVKTVSAENFQPACPFGAQSGRTIVHFEDTNLSSGVMSDRGAAASMETRSASLSAGTYNISLQAFDGGDVAHRSGQAQPNERYFLKLLNGGSVVAQTNATGDLADNIANPVWSGRVNSSLVLSQSVNTVVAVNAAYPDSSSPNSVNVGCAAFDLVTPPPPPPETLNGSCSVNPSSVSVNGTINWSASATGANGSYTYSWSGTDSLAGNSNSVSKVYPNAGTKTGTVTITSGSQSIQRTCSAVVNQPVVNNLSVSCDVSDSSIDVNEDVTWGSTAVGGNGSYTYSWSGTDGLSGSGRNINWSYDDNGTKRGTVTVISDGQSASASCTVRVNEEEQNDDLSVSCYASPTSIQLGDRVRWYVDVSGGDGNYDYDWSGTDGLNSSSRTPNITYDMPGSKRATVTVTDGDGQEDSDTCYANVNQNVVLAFSQVNQQPLVDAVYLNQVPYTGVADNIGLYFFFGMLTLFSAWIAYIAVSRNHNPYK